MVDQQARGIEALAMEHIYVAGLAMEDIYEIDLVTHAKGPTHEIRYRGAGCPDSIGGNASREEGEGKRGEGGGGGGALVHQVIVLGDQLGFTGHEEMFLGDLKWIKECQLSPSLSLFTSLSPPSIPLSHFPSTLATDRALFCPLLQWYVVQQVCRHVCLMSCVSVLCQ